MNRYVVRFLGCFIAFFSVVFLRGTNAVAGNVLASNCRFDDSINYREVAGNRNAVYQKGYFQSGLIGGLKFVPWRALREADRIEGNDEYIWAYGCSIWKVPPTMSGGFWSGIDGPATGDIMYVGNDGIVIGTCVKGGVVTFQQYIDSRDEFRNAQNSGSGWGSGYWDYEDIYSEPSASSQNMLAACNAGENNYRIPNGSWAAVVASGGIAMDGSGVSHYTEPLYTKCCLKTVGCRELVSGGGEWQSGAQSAYYFNPIKNVSGMYLAWVAESDTVPTSFFNNAYYTSSCIRCPTGSIYETMPKDSLYYYSQGSGVTSCRVWVSGAVDSSGNIYNVNCSYVN